MFRRFAHTHTVAQVSTLVGVLWFIHDEPGITEKVPYTNEQDMLDAIRKFLARFGGDHKSEFLVIFCDDNALKAKIQEVAKAVTGAEYPINATSVANKLF